MIKKIIFISGGIALLVIAVSAAFLLNALYRAPDSRGHAPGADDVVSMTVMNGTTFSSITRTLHSEGLIEYPRIINGY
ncbi:MAG: hypothetical protein ABIA59_04435, partial [Candidatus Latescibacterota bacterium]